MAQPRIFTVRIKAEGDATNVLVEYGAAEISRPIPEGQGLIRLSAVLDASGKLVDAELITAKLES